MKEIAYNDNITIYPEKVAAPQNKSLSQDEWNVLMVASSKTYNDDRKFFDESKGWLGLERTSQNTIYISKAREHATYPFGLISGGRGTPMVAIVKDTTKCCVLGE